METAAVIFVLVMLGLAYVVFRILKKTVKMAVRALVVLVILVVAAVGGAALLSIDGAGDERPSGTRRSR